MRRLVGIIAITVLGAALWGGVSTAGAQTQAALSCSFTVSATDLPVGGGSVTISGTAPADTDVFISVNGKPAATVHSSPINGAWGPTEVPITDPGLNTIAVTLTPNYSTLVCTGPATVSVAAAAAALPRTGSNDTKPFVLAGVTLLVVGLSLVMATRRREHTRGRA